jgi:hypothetical protein
VSRWLTRRTGYLDAHTICMSSQDHGEGDAGLVSITKTCDMSDSNRAGSRARKKRLQIPISRWMNKDSRRESSLSTAEKFSIGSGSDWYLL